MDNTRKAIKVAKVLKSTLTIEVDYESFFVVDFQHCWIKDGHMLLSFNGRGETVDSACEDLISKTSGTIVNTNSIYHEHGSHYEINMVAID
jgi:hypothetical protein